VAEDELLLLLPHPAIAITLSSGITMETQLFGVRTAFLLHFRFHPEVLARICDIVFRSENF
jgi:hypothetical protein